MVSACLSNRQACRRILKKKMTPRDALDLLSPAKVNLSLEVLDKRRDGYHDIRTVFERIGLCDRIRLKKLSTGEIRFHTDSKEVPSGPDNLAFKAAALLKSRFSVRDGVQIHLEKRIPVQAGLGGGSGNAATVLLGLNRLWKLRLSRKALLKLGAELGSDVPFFILETSFALGEGRGEILKVISAPGIRIWHCIVKPPFGISTQEAYEWLDRGKIAPPPVCHGPFGTSLLTKAKQVVELTLPKTDVRILVRSLQKGRFRIAGSLLANDLELSLNKRVRIISNLKKTLLDQGAFGALMSGSGSAVLGLFDSEKAAKKTADFVKKNKIGRVFVAKTY